MDNKDITKLKFLPIGSIVLLKNAKKRVMVNGFCIIDEEKKNMYDYSGCLYPEGMIDSKQNLAFNHNQIEKIFFIGYSDNEEKDFKVRLNDLVKKGLQKNEKEEIEELN